MKDFPDAIWTDKKRLVFGLPISFTRYILTEKKLITRVGFLNIVEKEVELYRVIDKSLRLPLGQRIFGCGTVLLNCSDVDTPVNEVKSIKNPRKFAELLEKYVDIQKEKYRVRGRDTIGSFDGLEDVDDIDDNDNV